MLPNFLVIGSAKAGTTSLYYGLREHPEIGMAEPKEVHFFEKEHRYRRGMAFYERHFAHCSSDLRVIGENTPVYVCHPSVPERIKQHLPDAKLIVTVRDPVKRAYSHYWNTRKHLAEPLEFEEVIAEGLSQTYQPGERGYFSRGLYLNHIRRYLEFFDRSRILVLVFEDLIQNPAALYQACFEFLGVDSTFRSAAMERVYNQSWAWNNPLYNSLFENPHRTAALPVPLRRGLCFGRKRTVRYPPMSAEAREELAAFFEEPNRQLAEFLERDLGHWTAPGQPVPTPSAAAATGARR